MKCLGNTLNSICMEGTDEQVDCCKKTSTLFFPGKNQDKPLLLKVLCLSSSFPIPSSLKRQYHQVKLPLDNSTGVYITFKHLVNST